MRRILIAIAAAGTVLSQGAAAQQTDYSGRWLMSGLTLFSRGATSFAQICDLKQTNSQIAGPCHGPNGACSAVGVVNGDQVDLTCRLSVPNNPSLDGVLTVHVALSPDGVWRGNCSSSRLPGATGQVSLMRI